MRAIFLNLSAHTIVPINYGIAKLLADQIPILQIIWARHFFTIICIFPIMFFFFKEEITRSENPKLQLLRGIILLTVNISFLYSVTVIPLSKALTLTFISPFVVTIFSSFFLSEKVGLKRWTAVIIGFSGTLIVIRPGYVPFELGSLVALFCGFVYGFYIIITRKLSASDSSLLTLIITGLIGTIVMTPVLAFVWVTPSKEQWYLLFLIGLVTTIGHLLLILSFKYSEASKLAPLSYFEIVSNTIVGYLLFKNFPDNWTLIGLFIIISSGLFVFYREKKVGII